MFGVTFPLRLEKTLALAHLHVRMQKSSHPSTGSLASTTKHASTGRLIRSAQIAALAIMRVRQKIILAR